MVTGDQINLQFGIGRMRPDARETTAVSRNPPALPRAHSAFACAHTERTQTVVRQPANFRSPHRYRTAIPQT